MNFELNTNLINESITNSGIEILYFSTESCNVCKVLKPKIKEIISKYNNINFVYINTELFLKDSANYSVFSVPTILITIDGKEYQRFNRNMSLDTFAESLERYFNLYTNK